MDGVDGVDTGVPELPDVEMPIEYRTARARRNSLGRRRVAESGRVPNGRAPFGYSIVTKRDVMLGIRPLRDLGKLMVHEENAGVVRGIFQDYLLLRSVVEVASVLNGRRTPPPMCGPWTGTGVANLLRNSAYVGRYVWGRSEPFVEAARTGFHAAIGRRLSVEERHIIIPCPALVSERTFLLVQELLRNQEPGRRVRGEARQPLLLGDVARCTDCGGLLVSGSYAANRAKNWTGGGFYACKRCGPCLWNADSPRPKWRLYRAISVERLTWAALEPLVCTEDRPIVSGLVFAGEWRATMRSRRRLLLQAGITPWVQCDPFAVTIGYREAREATDEQRSVLAELLVTGAREIAAKVDWALQYGLTVP